eukprot:7858847-Pyramimonas_sp.AAC.1
MRGQPIIATSDVETTRNLGRNDSSHIDHPVVSEDARTFLHSVQAVVGVPWEPHLGLLIRLRRGGRQFRARYLDMPQ